jgi:hypothetical protein
VRNTKISPSSWSWRRFIGAAVATIILLALSACSSFDRRSAVPPGLRHDAAVVGLDIQNARFFRDQPALISAEQERALIREAKHLGVGRGGALPTANILALSGGGPNGAFGAGLMVGWTAHGDRPKFKLVTGISTGSLIAPFAFLGPEYDAQLTEVYTRPGLGAGSLPHRSFAGDRTAARTRQARAAFGAGSSIRSRAGPPAAVGALARDLFERTSRLSQFGP